MPHAVVGLGGVGIDGLLMGHGMEQRWLPGVTVASRLHPLRLIPDHTWSSADS
jgi:hypothetical protein